MAYVTVRKRERDNERISIARLIIKLDDAASVIDGDINMVDI